MWLQHIKVEVFDVLNCFITHYYFSIESELQV